MPSIPSPASVLRAGEALSRQPVAGPLLKAGFVVPLTASKVVRSRFRARVSGEAGGAPEWVRAVADQGSGPGWFEPDGVVWRVHGDLSTLVGGVAALLGQATHPLALAGVEQHSNYRDDPWKRLSGTARWLVTTTFGSAELAERESARVRGMHKRVVGATDDGQAYAASDPALLRWVHLAFTDAFLHAQLAVGADLTSRFGRDWPDAYVKDWSRSAVPLGATDLPTTAVELSDAIWALRPQLEEVPASLRSFLLSPPGLNLAERAFYATLSRAGGLLLHPALASLAHVPGRDRAGLTGRLELSGVRLELAGVHLLLGSRSPSESAARYRVGLEEAPPWKTA